MIFTVSNIIFVIIFALLTIVLTFLTTKGGLTDNRFSQLHKKLTKRGKYVLGVLILIVVLLVLQEYNNHNIQDNSDFALKTERDKRDSIISIGIKTGIDSSNNNLFQNLSKSFAKQGFKIDALNYTIVQIRDSIKNNHYQDFPVLRIDTDAINFREQLGNKYFYDVTFSSRDASSRDFHISSNLLIEYVDKTYSLRKLNFFPDELTISKNGTYTVGFFNIPRIKVANFYITLTGTYKPLDKSITIPIKHLYQYSPKTEKTGIPTKKRSENILNIIDGMLAKNLNLGKKNNTTHNK